MYTHEYDDAYNTHQKSHTYTYTPIHSLLCTTSFQLDGTPFHQPSIYL